MLEENKMLFKDITIIDENYETRKNMYVGTSGDIIAYISDVMPEESYGEVYSLSLIHI